MRGSSTSVECNASWTLASQAGEEEVHVPQASLKERSDRKRREMEGGGGMGLVGGGSRDGMGEAGNRRGRRDGMEEVGEGGRAQCTIDTNGCAYSVISCFLHPL